MDKKIKRAERICIAAMIILAAVALTGSILLLVHRNKQLSTQEQTIEEENDDSQAKGLTEEKDYLPSEVLYGKKLPVTDFTDEAGGKKNLSEYEGKMLVLFFWGSWCKYCEELLGHSGEFQELVQEREDTNILLINKLDSEKGESKEKVQAMLKEKHTDLECLYDKGLKAYQAYGIKRIPTMIVLDDKGIVRYTAVDTIESKMELDAILDYVKQGGSSALEKFITQQLTGTDGGVYTNYTDKRGNPPEGHDVLSESQGLMMEYAVMSDNQVLFDKSYNFLKKNMYHQGIFSWYVTQEGQQAGANALLDDLRIYRALSMAHEQWGGYGEEMEELSEAILKYNVYEDGLSSFYDFSQESPGDSISLCYGDFRALQKLQGQNGEFKELCEKMETIIQDGYISDEFPLYYTSYECEKKAYSQESMNTAEALMTLYHLAGAGMLKDESEKWLEKQLAGAGLAARYRVDGSVVQGFDYETTAVYAIAALIGYEQGNARIFTRALQEIEQNRVWDKESSFYGGFLNSEDQDNVIAFDQLMPLLLYEYSKGVVFKS